MVRILRKTKRCYQHIIRQAKKIKTFDVNKWLWCYSNESLSVQVSLLSKWMPEYNANEGNKWILRWMLNSRYNLEINTVMNLLNGMSDGGVKWANVDRYYHNTKKISMKMRLWERPRNRPVTSTMRRINSTIEKRSIIIDDGRNWNKNTFQLWRSLNMIFPFSLFFLRWNCQFLLFIFFCKVFFFSGSTSTASDVIVDAQERV
jgi:hypothetical protein